MIRGLATEAGRAARLARDLPAFVRRPITAAAAAAAVRDDLARRPERLVGLIERAVYANPVSPYRHLLAAAGCEAGDLRALVAREGLEGALRRLAQEGVYVTNDELKGRQPIARGRLRLDVAESHFDNPLVASHLGVRTGGSGGAPSQVGRSLPLLGELARGFRLVLDAHGAGAARHAIWHPRPFHWFLIVAKLGQAVDAWFHPLPLSLRSRLGAAGLRALGRLAGAPIPAPRLCDLREPARLLDWLRAHMPPGEPVCVWTYSSSAARLAAGATERGQRLDGVTMVVQGEPFTEARRRAVEVAGARAVVRYGSMEVPTIALSCANGVAADDLHLMSDRYAMIRRPREVAGTAVDALAFTALSPAAPKILLNVETGDSARVEDRACGCALQALGLTTHLCDVVSFDKLTGEGMTFARTDLVRVIEQELPARFGGGALDYQLLEEEGPGGATRLALLVSPAVGPLDAAAVRAAFLERLGRDDAVARLMVAFWARVGTVEVRREPPRATQAGKVLPFHLARLGARGGAAPPGHPAA